jgi:putative PEP-CTERM system histidine kinase
MPDHLSPSLIGFAGYAAAAFAFGVLGILLLTAWRGRMLGGLLFLAVLTSIAWALVLASQTKWQVVPYQVTWAAEAARSVAWCVFLTQMLIQLRGGGRKGLRLLRNVLLGGGVLLLLPFEDWFSILGGVSSSLRLIAQLLLVVATLFLIEQLYRSTPWQHRWGIKLLCFGLGAAFVYDFYFFADALLFGRIDRDLWLARGGVNAVVVPMLAVSVARNPQWSFDLSVSRAVVVHSTTLIAAGSYLLLMALAGYYIRVYGGEWSAVFQPLFFFGAVLLLIVLLFSGQLRSRVKGFVNQNFYSYRYDYRAEWLRLISVLSGKILEASLPERVIYALGELVDSPGGAIWIRNVEAPCTFRQAWNLPLDSIDPRWRADDLCKAFEQDAGVREIGTGNDEITGTLPDWLRDNSALWLLVPLVHEERVLGFVLLSRPRSPLDLDWENRQLLHTAARQAASYLAFEEAATALAEARQFEGFNRLSAFVVHDLKNLVAQLSLVGRNAERYRDNPEFVDDALQTVRDSVERMNRLLWQLRSAVPSTVRETVALGPALQRVVEERSIQRPKPELRIEADVQDEVRVDTERLDAILRNVIQNAQDATRASGHVAVTLRNEGTDVIVDIEDDGCGMDEAFIRERLFRPFDSTKGLAGMGIGAYECRSFVVSAGGRVDVDSELGQGTRLSIRLPMAAAETRNPSVAAAV